MKDDERPPPVPDLELLRGHLGIDRWTVVGSSWGVTLGLAYAQAVDAIAGELDLLAVVPGRFELAKLAADDLVGPAHVGLVARPGAQEVLARHLGVAGGDVERGAFVFLGGIDHFAQLAHERVHQRQRQLQAQELGRHLLADLGGLLVDRAVLGVGLLELAVEGLEHLHAARDLGRVRAGVDRGGFLAVLGLVGDLVLDAQLEEAALARVLGPKGLMPNPKSGTVTDDIAAGIKAVKAGRVEFKMDKAANIGVGIGKRSFTPAQLIENATTVIEAIGKAKPASFKGHYIKTVVISSSQSPSVRLASTEFNKF